jgi:hypothetical protein
VEIQELFANVRVADDLMPALLRIYETIAEDETWLGHAMTGDMRHGS